MLSAAKAVLCHLWNMCVFCHTYTHSTAFTRGVVVHWQIYFKNKYWISSSFISLSVPEFNIWPWKRCEWLN